MKSRDILELIKFTEIFNEFSQVKRKIYAVGEDRYENDAEHSFQVAVTSWYLIDKYHLHFNLEKVFKYALAHDLLELYTGDYLFEISQEERQNKKKSEELAFNKLQAELKDFPSILAAITSYECKADEEAKFVNAVEKLIPLINIYNNKGKTWKEEGMEFTTIVNNKDVKIGISQIPKELWDKLKPILKKSGYLKL